MLRKLLLPACPRTQSGRLSPPVLPEKSAESKLRRLHRSRDAPRDRTLQPANRWPWPRPAGVQMILHRRASRTRCTRDKPGATGIRNRSQLHHAVLDAELRKQRRSRLGAVSSGIVFGAQAAGKKEPQLPAAQPLAYQRQGAEQGLKISVVVVVADDRGGATCLFLLPGRAFAGCLPRSTALDRERMPRGRTRDGWPQHHARSTGAVPARKPRLGATVRSAQRMERRARLPLSRVSSHKPYSRRWRRSRRKSAEV